MLDKTMLTLSIHLLVPTNEFLEVSLHIFFKYQSEAAQPVDRQTVFSAVSETGCNISCFLFLSCFSFLFIEIMKSQGHTLVNGYLSLCLFGDCYFSVIGRCSKLPSFFPKDFVFSHTDKKAISYIICFFISATQELPLLQFKSISGPQRSEMAIKVEELGK